MDELRRGGIAVIDFGSQYTQLIARRVRELGVYSQVYAHDGSAEHISEHGPAGFILSGGPASVYDRGAPGLPAGLMESGLPLLGICYGMQLLTEAAGGGVAPSKSREYGPASISQTMRSPLLAGLDGQLEVWMSHGDRIERLPPGYEALAQSDNSPYAAIGDLRRRHYGLQFHPEVQHSPQGQAILSNFLFDICGCQARWTAETFINAAIERIRAQVKQERVLLALSGGVDSAVAAALIHRAIGERLTCVFVDHGLLRQGEAEQVARVFQQERGIKLIALRAADAIFTGELAAAGLLRHDTAQCFAVLLPVKSVGVMGDKRSYEEVLVLRAVTTDDFMTADWARLPYELLARVSARIVNEVAGINRVAYDITSKPPGTIEWE